MIEADNEVDYRAQQEAEAEGQAQMEAEAAEQLYYKEMESLRELRKSLNNIEGLEVPFNIIQNQINPLINWLDSKLDEKLNDGGS